MDNENKNIFTPSSAASLDRLRERRNTASTGDDTGGEAVSAAQSGPENGQSRIPKILNPEARAAQRAESGEAPNETGPAASDAVRQTVQNGVGGEPTCAPQQAAQSAARRNMPGNIRQASTGGARQPMTEPKRSETANRVRQADRAASPRQSLQPDAAKARRNVTHPGTARGQQNPARTGAGRASRDSAQSVGVPRPRTQPMGAVPSDKSNGSGVRAVDVSDLRKRKSGFFRGLRIYIIIALAVIAVGLGVFYAFMSAFEYTRPENRIKDYFSSLDGSAVYSLISERRGADEENAAALAADISAASDSLSSARTGGTGDDGSLSYGVIRDGKTVALVTIAPSGQSRFGLEVYSVTSCRLVDSYVSEFLPTFYSAEIHAPSSGTVVLCGETLERASAEQGAVYPILDGLSAYSGGDDRELVYRVDDLTEQPSAQYIDSAGATFEGSFDLDGVCRFDGAGSAPLAESCTQTVEKFIETYVTYTAAGYTDGTMAKFVATRSLTWQGSEAYEDITASRFSFAQNIPCTVKSLDITAYDFFSHGADMFSCKVDFTAEMKNFGQKTDTVKGAELVFARSGADFLLVRMRLS